MKEIFIKGAKENNLKNIDLEIPRDKLVVFTGLSGSGKSSLAFDTIFAEGQRRYMESLSSYARQFLGQMQKPDVEYIEGLSPAVSIDQKTTSHNPRSTVGTVTEIYDYMRLLYARAGIPHCPKCGKEIVRQTVDQIADRMMTRTGAKLQVIAPVVRGRKGEYVKQLETYRRAGYVRVRVDGINYTLDEDIDLDKNVKHDIGVVVDRLVVKEGINRRLTEAIETAVKLSDGLVLADYDGEEVIYSTRYACPDCEISIEELTPRLFSFNNPYGACPVCAGLGFTNEIDVKKLIANPDATLREGGIRASGWYIDTGKMTQMQFRALSKEYGFSLDVPVKELPQWVLDLIFYGNGGTKIPMEYSTGTFSGHFHGAYEGIANNLLRRFNETDSEMVKMEISRYMKQVPCTACGGKRLKPEALSVTVGGKNIWEACCMTVTELASFLSAVEFTPTEKLIVERILKEINARLRFLSDVGLGYLTLARSSSSLSGGESQRIRLATQIGSGLTGVLYILDEPSIGLHQKDNRKLLDSLKGLRDLGNTLIVVEHDEETIREADYIVDIGPGAGVHGGEVVAAGSVEDIIASPDSVTGKYLSGEYKIEVPEMRRAVDADRMLVLKGVRQNNLKGGDVAFPVGVFTAVTGVSGSGKSSLVGEILYPAMANRLMRASLIEGDYDSVEGVEFFDKVIAIDQSPIGRTPRSNPATYTDVFTPIRELFAGLPDAKARGYKSGRFSFNVSGGRCENCHGDGIIKILAIGNSFSQDAVEQYLWELFDAAGFDAMIGNLYIGGCTLERHYKNMNSGEAAYAYRKIVDGVKTERANTSLLTGITDEDWDYISFQEQSGLSGIYESYASSLPHLVKWAKENAVNPDMQVILHQTWAFPQSSTYSGFANYGNDQMTMFDAITDAVNRAADLVDIDIIIPVGTAIQNGRTSYLGDTFNRDDRHLEKTYGRYTASCTWFEKLTGKDVTVNTYHPSTVSEYDAEIAQHAAHAAVAAPDKVTELTEYTSPPAVEDNDEPLVNPVYVDIGDPETDEPGWNNIVSVDVKNLRLDARNNTDKAVTSRAIAPDENGNIVIGITAGPGNTRKEKMFFLNAMRIEPAAL